MLEMNLVKVLWSLNSELLAQLYPGGFTSQPCPELVLIQGQRAWAVRQLHPNYASPHPYLIKILLAVSPRKAKMLHPSRHDLATMKFPQSPSASVSRAV